MTESKPASLDEWESSLEDTDESGVEDVETTPDPVDEPAEPDDAPASEDAPATESEDAPAAQDDDGEQSANDDTDAPVEESAVAPEVAASTTQPAPLKPEDLVPLRQKVDGKEIEFTGAKSGGGHKIIPDETWAREIVPRLADRNALMKVHKSELEQVRNEAAVKVHRAQTVLKMVEEALLSGDETKVDDFLSNLSTNLELLELRANAEVDRFEKSLGVQRKQAEDTERQQVEDAESHSYLVQSTQKTLERAVDMVLGEEGFKNLGLDRKDMLADVWDFRASIVREATERDEGRNPGDLVVDVNALRKMLRPAAHVARTLRSNAAVVAGAEKKNQAALRPSQAPPAVASRGTPASGGRAETKPKSLREWEDSLA